MRIEDVLKAKGLNDEDLSALAPLLANQKFRDTLEGHLAEAELAAETGRLDSAETVRWRQEEAIPKIEASLAAEREAKAELAAMKARVEAAQAQGLFKMAEQRGEVDPNKGASQFDPKAYNLVTHEDVAKFADLEGDAIAMAADLAAEYQELFPGKSLFSYKAQDGSTGMRALRKEALAARKTMSDYVAAKFNFAGRREALATEARAKLEAEIRADERAKSIAELTNPNARPLQASMSPLLPKPKDTAGKQPWDDAAGDRSGARVARVVAKLMTT